MLTAAGLAFVAPAAQADTAPPDSTTPATVSADVLPTVQQNGVVWSQVTVGNTVYAAGGFTSARPAGSPAGTNETPRKNLLAYDITTGNLITSFNHSLNAQSMVAAKSPDGTRLYIGGDFTTADGVSHGHIAQFNTATGALINTFAPNFNARVRAIAATNTTVYVGGSFTSVNGVTRNRLAALSASTGALLDWAPSADDNTVNAMVLNPSGDKVIIGGQFDSVNGQSTPGLGALDPSSGALVPFSANLSVQDSGANAGITSLRTDGNQIYGTGFVFGPGGNLEGTFAADPESGNINWIEDCHGDTYDSFATGTTIYVVSHEHFCGNIGSFPQTNPWTFYRATAFTTFPTQTIQHNSIGGYTDWYGNPAPSQLDWYPTLATGTVTGQNQAAWSATGNGSYLALGGEFPSVNGAAQQGLVRFAVKSIAPNKVGPRPAASLTPKLNSLSGGTARVAWQATFDQDNEALTYKVVRDGNTASPVYTTTVKSRFYNLPALGFTDTGLAPGSTHSYRIFVTDPLGNSQSGSTASVTISSATNSTYAKDVLGDGAAHYWRLGESNGTTGLDWAGYDDLTEGSGVSHGATGAINGDSNTASIFDGTSNGTSANSAPAAAPNTFTTEAWFNSTSTSGGKIIGYGDAATGTSSNYDRQVWLDNSGHLNYGVYTGDVTTLTTPGTYNDGAWHQVVASLSPAGMVLYVDGARVARNLGVTAGQPFTGYWRVGGDNVNFWPNQPSSNFLAGTIDEVAVYPTALSLTQVQQHYSDSGRAINVVAAPSDPYGKAVFADNPDNYWRLDDASGPTAADSSPYSVPGNYQGGITYGVTSPVTTQGKAIGTDGASGQIVSSQPTSNPTVYSEEAWFNTTTKSGGKILGFGDATSGESNNYDRHVIMLTDGSIMFGTWTGQTNIIQSAPGLNDGQWHHVVATQGPDGMNLYVDGKSVGTNPQTSAQPYTGYWRVGGDRTWGGTTSDYFAGTIDEVAFYSSELSASRVLAHYNAAASTTPPANTPPTAAFTSSCPTLSCSFDASASSAQTGATITGYAWDFGDGATGTGQTTSHSYAGGGPYSVTLTVTDSHGLTNSVTHAVSPTPPPPTPPTAAFTPSCTNLACSFDASASSAQTGATITGYAWDFGDGATGAGKTTSHTYAGSGTYSVTLTVTDSHGLTNSTTQTVSPTAAPTTLAKDTFNRTASNGWGTADQGGAWTSVGNAANLSVSGGTGSLLMPANGTDASAYLGGVSSSSSETDVTLTSDKAGTGGGFYAYVVGRRISANNQYQGRLKIVGSTVTLSLTRLTGSATDVPIGTAVNAPLSYTPGMQLKVRLQVVGTGTTTLRLKVWNAAAAEPSAWQIVATDTTAALQKAGVPMLRAYLSGSASNAPVAVKVSNFSVVPAA